MARKPAAPRPSAHANSPISPYNLSPHQFGNLTRQVTNTFKAASPETRAEGGMWYWNAHEHAEGVGKGDVTKGAGVIAALSPQQRWEVNLHNATKASRAGTAKGLHTYGQAEKAQRILDGEHPLEVLNGPKETAFFKNINDPDDPDPVTVDRHAHDIVAGRAFGGEDRGLDSKGRYNNISEVYRRAGARLGIERTNVVQAATWQHWTQRQGLHVPIKMTDDWQT